MSSSVTITLDPGTRGIPWEQWTAAHHLVLEPGNGCWYQGPVEVSYATEPWQVTFSTYHMGPALPVVANLALAFWAEFGGAMDACPELRFLIAGHRFPLTPPQFTLSDVLAAVAGAHGIPVIRLQAEPGGEQA